MPSTQTLIQSLLPEFFATWPFQQLTVKTQQQIASQLQCCSFSPGDVIYPARELPAAVHYIVQGQVRILGPEAYQSPTLAVLGQGAVMGWDSLLRRVAGCSVRAAIVQRTGTHASTPESEVLTIALPADLFENLILQKHLPTLNQRVSLVELFETLGAFLSAMPSYFSGIDLKEMVRYLEQEELAIAHHWLPSATKPTKLLAQLSDDRVWLVSGGASLNVPVGTPINVPEELHLQRPSRFPVRLLGVDRNFLASAVLQGVGSGEWGIGNRGAVESAIDLRLLPGVTAAIPQKQIPQKQIPQKQQIAGSHSASSLESSLKSSPAFPLESPQVSLKASPAQRSSDSRSRKRSYPVRRSPTSTLVEDLVSCFDMVCQFLQVPYRPDVIRRQLGQRSLTDFDPLELSVRIAQAVGLDAHIVQFTPTAQGLNRLGGLAILPFRGTLSVLYETTPQNAVLASPRSGLLHLSAAELADRLVPSSDRDRRQKPPSNAGAAHLDQDEVASLNSKIQNQKSQPAYRAVLLKRLPQTPIKQFGFRWFLPQIVAQRGILTQVLVASAFVQLLGLANPLLVQQVIDKVIVNANSGAMTTFGVLMILFAALEGILTVLRTYLFANTTLRLDLRLGTEIVRHLLHLPLQFFEKRPVGELSARLSELEKIRQFFTGTALTAVLDVTFSFMYVAVMFLYSVPLTFCVLLSLPIILLSTLLVSSIQRKLIRIKSDHGAKVQSYLIESLSGMFTVKAQHMENLVEATWRDRYVQYLSSGFTTSTVMTLFGSFNNFLNSASGFLVLWVGAGLVVEGQLTLGGLIAFRILSGSVTGPLIRLSRLWQQVQETSLSMELLADIVETPLEAAPLQDDAHVSLPPIVGHVQYREVCFGFKAGQQQLSSVSLEIPAESFVGIVGQSGSGKSTLVKLLPRLYMPQSGQVLIDGFDIGKVKLDSLRRQIGYVPQDAVLFEGTIRDNITQFTATEDEEVIAAARIADAHDFIMQLPEGYNTPVGERGSTLSGGQRQRIAIARVVLTNPRLLIFDEATSALDYATERRVCAQLKQKFRDRTVFFITHRLNTIATADWILYMQSGILLEQGTHADLMAKQQLYYSLFRQANGS